MDVFELQRKLIADYAAYVRGFITIQDKRINDYVQSQLDEGFLWPEPLIQMNPSFEPGGWIDELVQGGLLHPECSSIFRVNKDQQNGSMGMRLHRHQVDAVKAAAAGDNYVLTTGTGSGKSLAYIVPIVDYVLKHRNQKGVKAIVVYPMNALANSQYGELNKFLGCGYQAGHEPVRFRKYTGQESDEEREEILRNPPDILLTNYVMLELLLTRVKDRPLINAAKDLRFLVLDELHTYRGRQGADVAMLIRRLRHYCGGEQLRCIGTSATMGGTGSFKEQQAEVAKVASLLFGSEVKPERVIGETLRRSTTEYDYTDDAVRNNLCQRIQAPEQMLPTDCDTFIHDPLASWIESTFGVTKEKDSGRLVRSTPISVSGEEGAARQLAALTGCSEEQCVMAIQTWLMQGYKLKQAQSNFPIFAFRLHQFISRGDKVYASLENAADRHITIFGQQFVPGDPQKILLPLAFCRECGQEFYAVTRVTDQETGERHVVQWDFDNMYSDNQPNGNNGFLFVSEENPWPDDEQEELARLPDDWVEIVNGLQRLRKDRKDLRPRNYSYTAAGMEGSQGIKAAFMPAPFHFCPNCGVSYPMRKKKDFAKIGTLGSEGRSTATTVLTLSAVKQLKVDSDLPVKAQKLLSFTDNRQDASLQAGHFNDFVQIGLLRGAIYQALAKAGEAGLRYDEIAQKVFQALDLPIEQYASDPNVKFAALIETKRAMTNVIGYRIYQDMKRGWRITSPNLEQCDLLKIEYETLSELCASEDEWQGTHSVLLGASPEIREKVAKVLLDHMRRNLAIKTDYLTPEGQDRIKQQSSAKLISPWAIDEAENMEYATILYPRRRRPHDTRDFVFLSDRSGYAQYLRRTGTFPDNTSKLNAADIQQIIMQLLQVLSVAGLVEVVREPVNEDDAPGYQLCSSALIWRAGEGRNAPHDPIYVPSPPAGGIRVNPFFVDFYQKSALQAKGIEAHEHTAQVPYELREEREENFREGRLSLMFCSPTMELGVDISQLNVVNMRNIPPTPANYAQRSGRAGRSGQPALVFTYCALGSPHDQYFFKRPQQMVSGIVTPPRIDLANEDLIISHLHAVWLTESNLDLKTSMQDILDLSGELPSLAFHAHIKDGVDKEVPRIRAMKIGEEILADLVPDLKQAGWYSPSWIKEVVARIPLAFEASCKRWRGLYEAALNQREIQHRVIMDMSRSHQDRETAKRLRAEAEAQINLLIGTDNIMQSDFYTYRYFASEGFLPGYNFPRLPLSAFIPGRRTRKDKNDEFLSRPRFLAISEFGPRSVIYHEGSRYLVHRVILPARENQDGSLPLMRAKVCPACGYMHPLENGEVLDLCELCGSNLDKTMTQLLRMQNVATRRRERINSDEEERMRQGYELNTAFRFINHGGHVAHRVSEVKVADETLFTLTYGQSAKIWRINLGWRRRKNKDIYGFILDTEKGYWARNPEGDEEDTETQENASHNERVIPFVEDHRNCLLIRPMIELPLKTMVSLQTALKNAIQVRYQLEDGELAAEPLPSAEDRRQILLYESAEGGAGVLRRLVDDPDALADVAREALMLCHFDPDTNQDMRRGPRGREDCVVACYDCLLSYANQRDHSLLDRHSIRELLNELTRAKVVSAPAQTPRGTHLEQLLAQCGSDLEREWLKFLDSRDCRLPTRAQVYIETCETRPDFIYDNEMLVVYVDGPHHLYPERQRLDRQQEETLLDMGYDVIRFGCQDDWEAILRSRPGVFGKLVKSE